MALGINQMLQSMSYFIAGPVQKHRLALGLGFGLWGLGFRGWFGLWGLGFKVSGVRFRDFSFGFRKKMSRSINFWGMSLPSSG